MSTNKNSERRLEDLLAFSMGIMNGEDGRMLIEKYKDAIDNVTPHDMLRLEDKQMQMGMSPDVIKKDVEKIINVFSKSLERYEWEKPKEGAFLYYLMLENEAFKFKLNQIKKILRSYKGREATHFQELKEEVLPRFIEFIAFDYHYIKKENILFPYLEKVWTSYRPLKVMWSLHDDIRRTLKEVIALLEDPFTEWSDFNSILGRYYSLVFRMIQKEDIIIFPVASKTVSEESWHEMHLQSFDYPFPFIETPEKPEEEKHEEQTKENILTAPGMFVTETGNMTLEQVLLVFNHLPVDITVVDENDKVLFFNKPKERYFPRSPAIVGRSVNNCHPPESVHIVEEIVETFKKGERDTAMFWIELRGHFILIQYFALRTEKGEYRGVMEVSQDATDIRKLEGQRRLLNWE
ncbi:MAG TPA: PAS domain-containing protein [Dysgonamonadaceae bacterium]|nr:PAS domain-containing protein [Dysgonamonadaceae bacterium]